MVDELDVNKIFKIKNVDNIRLSFSRLNINISDTLHFRIKSGGSRPNGKWLLIILGRSNRLANSKE